MNECIEENFKEILFKNNISFGTVQKILNLYLKYLWTTDQIKEPPHCPIDSIILNKLGDNSTEWTKIKRDKYIDIIEGIKKVKGNKSISEWELVEFSMR